MPTNLYDPDALDEDLDDGMGPRGAGALTAPDDDDAGGATIVDDPSIDEPTPSVEPAAQADDAGDPEPPAPVDPTLETGAPDDAPPPSSAPIWITEPISPDLLNPAEIFRDRPDVYEGFFKAFYGPNNDHHSGAWVDRVGAETPEAYALYWYKTYGFYEGYVPSSMRGESGAQGAPLEPEAFGGRTTSDGLSLDFILHDRPDVFQGFFSEFYGPNNDHHSNAWNDRVGGETPQDYANYWYETYGKASGYGAQFHAPVRADDDIDAADGEAAPVVAPAGDDGLFLLT